MADSPARLQIRRARRTDFAAVMQLLASNDLPLPPADRATLRRFRHIVSDLGADFYLAIFGDDLVGLVYATYTRRLADSPLARIEQLVVRREADASQTGAALVEFIRLRSGKRRCSRLVVASAACCGVALDEVALDGARSEDALALGVELTPGALSQAPRKSRHGRNSR